MTLAMSPGCHESPTQHVAELARVPSDRNSGSLAGSLATAATDAVRPMVVHSHIMHDILDQVRRVAMAKVAVLIEGESGTGKELIARYLHTSSPRARKPFIGVNCAALSESLVESELFGHERGAFTGAEQCRAGRFERAHGGTLLLDEISEMSVNLQAKLLRVLEEEEIERVGGNKPLPVDVRLVATTNRSLERESEQGNFRRDLFYRLNAVHFQLPPLRTRREDILPLANYFVSKFGNDGLHIVRGISRGAAEILSACSWPGNVRQLRNVIHRACILARSEEIAPADLPDLAEPVAEILHFPTQTIADMERHMILQTLRELGGNKTAAAARLGVTARTLLNKLKKYRDLEAA
jgi:DNA-binding NtrC family response regulator